MLLDIQLVLSTELLMEHKDMYAKQRTKGLLGCQNKVLQIVAALSDMAVVSYVLEIES